MDSGGITPNILVGILCHYNKYIPRVIGDPIPACILDGHGSRLSTEVGDYIRNYDGYNNIDLLVDHAWHLYIGQLNGTVYWQVGDSLYQNDRYKNLGRKIKKMIRDKQQVNFQSKFLTTTKNSIFITNIKPFLKHHTSTVNQQIKFQE